jgi:hypothetical protein
MRKVYKYTLALQDEQTLMLPKDASILSIQMQGGGDAPQIWALVEPEKPKAPRKIRVYGTGHGIEDGPLEFIGTFQIHGGALVFHAFEVLPG